MSRRAGIGAAVALLAGCGGSQSQPVAGAGSSSQGPAATAPTATAPAAAHHSARRPQKPTSARGGPRAKPRRRPGSVRTTATATTPARPPAGTSTRHASARQGGVGGGGSQSAGAVTIALVLHGGANAGIRACGAEHHYRTYKVGAPVALSGTVRPIPSRRWKVKLKIKVCSGGSFADFAKLDATRDKHNGTFSASFQAPAAGLYEARAVLYLGGSEAAKSNKRHIATR